MANRTTEEAAKRLNLSPNTLEVWRCKGGGPKFKKFGRAVRYADEDLDAFEDECTRRNTSETEAA